MMTKNIYRGNERTLEDRKGMVCVLKNLISLLLL